MGKIFQIYLKPLIATTLKVPHFFCLFGKILKYYLLMTGQ